MLTESITYLKNSDDVWKTSIIGGILLLFGFLLIPLFIVWGYVIQVLARTAHGDDEPPRFENWSGLTVDGAKAFVILLAYGLVPLAIGGVLFTSILAATGGSPGSIGIAGLLLAGLLTFITMVAAAYTVPAGLANFADTRRIGSGFDLDTIRPTLRTGTYATGWLLAFGIVLVGSFVAGILASIPFLGAILGAIVTFYALVAAYYVIGQTWEELSPVRLEEREQDDDLSTERPAV